MFGCHAVGHRDMVGIAAVVEPGWQRRSRSGLATQRGARRAAGSGGRAAVLLRGAQWAAEGGCEQERPRCCRSGGDLASSFRRCPSGPPCWCLRGWRRGSAALALEGRASRGRAHGLGRCPGLVAHGHRARCHARARAEASANAHSVLFRQWCAAREVRRRHPFRRPDLRRPRNGSALRRLLACALPGCRRARQCRMDLGRALPRWSRRIACRTGHGACRSSPVSFRRRVLCTTRLAQAHAWCSQGVSTKLGCSAGAWAGRRRCTYWTLPLGFGSA
mmetsp:Transcript_172334/g.547193  ORF Transcript_172334/g.547193 Transcript_172334/m.547193 type:complete len:276 (-) Transcript_172334:608-1435(-)